MSWQIAIDGPAASGKSTVAKKVAKKLNFEYLDTGAMYRAVTLKALNLGINLDNEDEYSFLEDTTIDFDNSKILLDGKDVSRSIRTLKVTNHVSLVSKFNYVREKMVARQREIAKSKNIILDGRDIGTVVLPNADLKIYLTASSRVRAQRRLDERKDTNIEHSSLEDTIKEIEERDYKDSNREISPLTQADDAILIDSSELSVEDVIKIITRLVLERGYSMENLEQKNEMAQEVKEDAVEETEALEVAEEVAAEEVAAEEVAEETTEEVAEGKAKYKEMQVVWGEVVEVIAAQPEKKFGNNVVKAKEERVLIELEDGSQGYLFKKDTADIAEDEELFDKFIEGDEVEVAIKKIFPDGGKMIFSTILVEKRNELVEFEKVVKERPTITAKVIKQVPNFGLLMKYEDFTCLLPTPLASAKEEEFASLIGKELEVVPIRIDLSRIRVIVSEVAAASRKARAAKKEFLNSIEVGQEFEGVVKNIESYGAFVELAPGVEGLLHISEVDHNRISKIEKVLNSGDTVKVKIIKVEKEHIGLSRKALLPNHWANFFDGKELGDTVTGKVVEINNAGVRLDLAEEIEGFLPRSEYSWNRADKVEDSIKVGDEVTAKLIEADKTKKRIILSTKQLTENPWAVVECKAGLVTNVTITEVREDSFAVDYNGLNGYMSKAAVGRNTNVNDLTVGKEIKVKVRVFDPEKNKLIVSMRDAEERVERENFNKYMKSQDKMTNTLGDYLNSLKK